ncbi:MAG: sigma-70 family RNA polymerase sigma factor [Bacteroidia bacterium]|nr:sigma-70 family RNA polymerase sigma factor [Bacteroidia bacterium]
MTQQEFEHISNRIRGKLLATAARFTRAVSASSDAEDMVQEALMTLWRLAEGGYPIRNAEALAMKITKNICVAHYRKPKPAETLEGRDAEGGEPATSLTDISDGAIIRDILMQGLTDTQRQCLELRNAAGLSLDEIAAVTGKPKSSVKTTISTARKHMLEQLKKQL